MPRALVDRPAHCTGIAARRAKFACVSCQVAELDAEAAAQFERASAAEEEAGAQQASAHASAQQLQDALAQMQVRVARTCSFHTC